MDIRTDAAKQDKQTKTWRCRNDHELGMIRWNGDGIPQLALYRHAVDVNAERPVEVNVIGVLEGRMPVVCDVAGCGAVQVWEVSAEVLSSMIASLNGEKLEQMIERWKERRNG